MGPGALFTNDNGLGSEHILEIEGHFRDMAMGAIKPTGYTPEEILDIEKAFIDGIVKATQEKYEISRKFAFSKALTSTESGFRDDIDLQFSGLMSVVDFLQEIHEVDDEIVRESKKQFHKHPQLNIN